MTASAKFAAEAASIETALRAGASGSWFDRLQRLVRLADTAEQFAEICRLEALVLSEAGR